MEPNPCLACGACCVSFRVSFYWAEADAAAGGVTPTELTTVVSPYRVAMRGTDQAHPHCIALEGEVGVQVYCRIYQQRPSPCREFRASWENGERNETCERARARYSLLPLAPALSTVK
ncbi:MAG: YkgJ family cysteine cluster protein [Candidatus Thiothrix singaporensis]|uniref:YkgJ family cysteine cluster protein n=1 Tax=Candidatus Thiothrix singaporensis TaxID=2799669 RepID=A0A7L6ASX3_9GAMM|nr:MAG: YkgJ family cysteine cluster protein [Candidatus Thiothrix singaporensis]